MIAALLLLFTAQDPAVAAYRDCVEHGVRHPEEESASFEDKLDMAKAGCGNLRPAAVAAIRKAHASEFAAKGGDVEAQALLDAWLRRELSPKPQASRR